MNPDQTAPLDLGPYCFQYRLPKNISIKSTSDTVLSAHNLCKQIGPRAGLTKCWAWSGSNLFDTQMVFLKEFFEKVDFEKISRRQKSMKNFPE